MTYDKFFAEYVKKIEVTVDALKDDLLALNATDLSQVARIQGTVNGLKLAKMILEAQYKEQDV